MRFYGYEADEIAGPGLLPDTGLPAFARCPLGAAFAGEGPQNTALMIVGEQPGDLEYLTDRPFINKRCAALTFLMTG